MIVGVTSGATSCYSCPLGKETLNYGSVSIDACSQSCYSYEYGAYVPSRFWYFNYVVNGVYKGMTGTVTVNTVDDALKYATPNYYYSVCSTIPNGYYLSGVNSIVQCPADKPNTLVGWDPNRVRDAKYSSSSSTA